MPVHHFKKAGESAVWLTGGDVILLLDYDGVLHPDEVYLERGRPTLRADGELFMWAHLLESVLESHPTVNIVLSTSWVRLRSFSRARNALPCGLRNRVIGATWHSRFDPIEWDQLTRYQQIRRYLARHPGEKCIALDDDDQGWLERDRSWLICTNPDVGISDPLTLSRLQEALKAMP